jgi:hypothetical protein
VHEPGPEDRNHERRDDEADHSGDAIVDVFFESESSRPNSDFAPDS